MAGFATANYEAIFQQQGVKQQQRLGISPLCSRPLLRLLAQAATTAISHHVSRTEWQQATCILLAATFSAYLDWLYTYGRHLFFPANTSQQLLQAHSSQSHSLAEAPRRIYRCQMF